MASALPLRRAQRNAERMARIERTITFAYQHFLLREPNDEEVAAWSQAIKNGLAPERFIDEVFRSEEARSRRSAKASGRAEPLGAGLSDGAFLVRAAGLLFGRGLLPAEIAAWQRRIENDPGGRTNLMMELVNQHIARHETPEPQTAHPCLILGTDRVITKRQWDDRQLILAAAAAPSAAPRSRDHPFVPAGRPKISMLASIYNAGRFIDGFLQNITAQTAFCDSELIIIDAASPERELAIIERYQALYPNIIYKQVGFPVGIYDAWNIGLELARGAYISNTNVDDLRRPDSIALQAAALDQNPEADVVYQDFFYSFNPQLSFEQVAAIGFKSELPIITPHNLLGCNSPHNAPMWRKQLHRDIGLFDANYKSAGDHEFWLRCLAAGKKFRKINTPHVVYFQNPAGMSTKPDSPGPRESHDIFNKYSEKLTSPALLQSRIAFMARIGLNDVAPDGDPRSYYDVAQDALVRLGSARLAGPPLLAGNDAGAAEQANPALRILIDGIGFQAGNDEVSLTLHSILSGIPAVRHVTVFILDRGGCPDMEGFHRVDFPAYYGAYTAADSLLIQQICDQLEIGVFTSTGMTSAVTTPQVHLASEVCNASAGSDHFARQRKEQCLAVAYSTRFACTCEAAVGGVLGMCPELHPGRITRLFAPAYQQAGGLKDEESGHGTFAGEAAAGARLGSVWRQVFLENAAPGTGTFTRNWSRIRTLQAEVDVGVD